MSKLSQSGQLYLLKFDCYTNSYPWKTQRIDNYRKFKSRQDRKILSITQKILREIRTQHGSLSIGDQESITRNLDHFRNGDGDFDSIS